MTHDTGFGGIYHFLLIQFLFIYHLGLNYGRILGRIG